MKRFLLGTALGVVLGIGGHGVVLLPTFPVTMAHAQATKNTQSLSEVADRTERAVAALIRAARNSKDANIGLDRESGKPFWAALKSLNESVSKMANGAALKDNSFHEGLSETVKHTAAVMTAFEMAEAKDDRVAEAISNVEKPVTAIQDGFSKAAARTKGIKSLSAAEKAKLEQIKADQKKLEARLDKVSARVRGNAKATAAVEEARRRAREVHTSGNSVGDFLAALIALQIIDGLLFGCHWWWGPWGGWYNDYSINIIEISGDVYDDIDYDWEVDAAFEIDVSDLGDEILLDDADYDDSISFIEGNDFALDTLGDEELAGLDMPMEADLADEDFGLSEDDLMEAGDLGDDDATLETMSEETLELNDADLSQEIEVEIEPEMLPDSAITIEPEILDVPEIAVEPEVFDAPIENFGGGDDFGGFDDFGGGLDDLGGGFDDF